MDHLLLRFLMKTSCLNLALQAPMKDGHCPKAHFCSSRRELFWSRSFQHETEHFSGVFVLVISRICFSRWNEINHTEQGQTAKLIIMNVHKAARWCFQKSQNKTRIVEFFGFRAGVFGFLKKTFLAWLYKIKNETYFHSNHSVFDEPRSITIYSMTLCFRY